VSVSSYREEALKAVQEAEQRGYQAGVEHARREFEQHAVQFKQERYALGAAADALAQQLEAHGAERTPLQPLLRYIMEQIYNDVKHRFSDCEQRHTPDEIVSAMKQILKARSEALARHLRDVPLLVKRETEASPPVVPQPPSAQVIVSPPETVNSQRSSIFHEYIIPLQLDISVSLQSKEKFENGAFGYITYEVRSSLIPIVNSDHRRSRARVPYTAYHRYRDFDSLNIALRKAFPYAILPTLPPKERSVGGSSRDEGFVSVRKRGLQLWIQHLCLHGDLQRSVLFANFLCPTGVPHFWVIESRQLSRTKSSTIHSRWTLVRKEPVSDTHIRSARSKYDHSTSEKEKAYRVLFSLTEDLKALEQPSKAVRDASVKLASALAEQATARYELAAALAALSRAEKNDGMCSGIPSSVAAGTRRSAQRCSGIESLVHEHLCEPISFYLNCHQVCSVFVNSVTSELIMIHALGRQARGGEPPRN
jgi:hypothetical protein